MDVSVVIVSYNTCGHLAGCIASIQATAAASEIIVVDNASGDGSAAMVRGRFPAVRVMENQRNIGFAAAVNQGASLAHGRYLLLLNPDTRVESTAIARMTAFMDTHPAIGVCAPENRNGADHELFGRAGEQQINYFHFPRFRGTAGMRRAALRKAGFSLEKQNEPSPFTESDDHILADWLRGCSLFVRADLFRRLGGFDTGFFFYLEDTDFCRRVGVAGLGCAVVKGAVVAHFGGESYRDEPGARLTTMLAPHFLRSKYHYVRQERGRRAELDVRLADLATGIAGLVRRLGGNGAAEDRRLPARLLICEALRPGRVARAHRNGS